MPRLRRLRPPARVSPPSWLVTLGVLLVALLGTPPLAAQAEPGAESPPAMEGHAAEEDGDDELSLMSLEELMGVRVEVTSVARKPQDLESTPAAVYVITSEDIRRSGLTTVAEVLRLAPGVHVARAFSHTWDIGVRGFNGGGSNKLLVMIDGRSVYTPWFAGVWWDVQDLVLEDIDRIEVVRGPGGATWGANAFSGVINVITKSAGATQGSYGQVEVGTEEWRLTARHGGTFGETGFWRAYAKTRSHDEMRFDGSDAHDDWSMNRGGFRMDWEETSRDSFTVQGDIYDGRENFESYETTFTNPSGFNIVRLEEDVGGANLLARWNREISDTESASFMAYYDNTQRFNDQRGEWRETGEVDFTHRKVLGDSHDLVWGGQFRVAQSDYRNSDQFIQDPDRRTTQIYSVFVQDEIDLVPDTLAMTLGNKFEHNSFTGWELQPTARMSWAAAEDQTVWAAVSRAVRTPSTIERDGYITLDAFPDDGTTGVDELVAFVPGPDFDVEEVWAYEAGWRAQLTDDLHVDVAAYYNDYDDLGTEEFGDVVEVSDTLDLFPLIAENNMSGRARGFEVAAHWRASDDWELDGSYTYQHTDLRLDPDSNDTFAPKTSETSPQDIFHLRSHHRLGDAWELDLLLFYVDELRLYDVDSYWRGDVRLGYRPREGTEIAVGVRNLFHDEGDEAGVNEVETESYVRATFRF